MRLYRTYEGYFLKNMGGYGWGWVKNFVVFMLVTAWAGNFLRTKSETKDLDLTTHIIYHMIAIWC